MTLVRIGLKRLTMKHLVVQDFLRLHKVYRMVVQTCVWDDTGHDWCVDSEVHDVSPFKQGTPSLPTMLRYVPHTLS